MNHVGGATPGDFPFNRMDFWADVIGLISLVRPSIFDGCTPFCKIYHNHCESESPISHFVGSHIT